MSRRCAWLFPSLIALTSLGLAATGAEEAPGLVVHEWGTFTSMQGSDGVQLDGLQHEEEGLPEFVHSRARNHGLAVKTEIERIPQKGMEIEVSNVSEKMETPVLYFYSERARKVAIDVSFWGGVLSQWYPYAGTSLFTQEGALARDHLDLSQVTKSSLAWSVEVLPPGEGLQALPPVLAGDPWIHARIPESNVVRTGSPAAADGGGFLPPESEKFLFYRGIGRSSLPLRAVIGDDRRMTLTTAAEMPLRRLFVVQVDHGRGAFQSIAGLTSAAPVAVGFPLDAGSEPLDAMVARLSDELRAALVGEGLFAKEAEAMTLTWQRSWLRSDGLRVLYAVPRETTEQMLPLRIEPKPGALERVLVGRLECMTPEAEGRVIGSLRALSGDAGQQRLARAYLAGLGRFREPYLRRALAGSGDPALRAQAEKELSSLSRGD